MILANLFGDKYTLWQIIQYYWPIFPAALAMGLLATPFCQKLAVKLNIVDMPDNTVKTHKKPTAYLGGIGILAGVLFGIMIGFWILYNHPVENLSFNKDIMSGYTGKYPHWLMLLCIGTGAGIACLVGLIDDLIDLKPIQKFIGQAVAAAFLWIVGIYPNISNLFNYFNVTIDPIWNPILGVPLILFFILGATNSLNLLDGLDGLCGGVTSIMTLAYLLLAFYLATWGYSPVGDPVRLIISLALAGGVLGFLPMNRHPAKIFMGDAGSMLLGYLAGALMLLFTEKFGSWSITAIVIFGLPILDTATAMIRRFLNKKPIFVSDRGHIYDQFMDRGWGLTKSVKVCYLLALLYAVVGLSIVTIRFRFALIMLFVVFGISGFLIATKGFLQISNKKDNISE